MAEQGLVKKALERTQHKTLLLAKKARQLVGNAKPECCVFIAGRQRSGTNMLMDVLERSMETDVYHESDARAFNNYEKRPSSEIHQLIADSRAPQFIIKALCESDHLKNLLAEFAPAKSVWMVRDYNDAVSSALVSFNNFAARVGRIAQDRLSSGWVGRGMSDETHALVRKLYTPEMDDATAAALIWYFRNVLYFEQNLHQDGRVILAHYENMVTAPEIEFPRIFDFLGLEYSSFVSRKVFASSIRRREPPVISAPVRELCVALTQRLQTVSTRA